MTASPSDPSVLSAVNHKIVAEGETLPLVRLKDGTEVQTGTVGAVLQNIRLYNQGERGQVEQDLQAAVPTLWRVGLFDLFTPQEFMAGDNAGRKYLGQLAQQYNEAQT